MAASHTASRPRCSPGNRLRSTSYTRRRKREPSMGQPRAERREAGACKRPAGVLGLSPPVSFVVTSPDARGQKWPPCSPVSSKPVAHTPFGDTESGMPLARARYTTFLLNAK